MLRGVVALIESLVIGVRALTRSANESLGEEEEELGKKEIGITLVIAFAFAVGLFFIAPLFLTGLLDRWLGDGFLFWLVEGLVRVGIFLAYLVVITRIRDLRRVCLLYTSDAADDLLCVDLGGRRIIKKKNNGRSDKT